MTIIIIILIVLFLLGLGGGAVAWFIFRHRQAVKSKEPTKETAKGGALPFHWNYIIAPLAILILSIILTAYFYHLLPQEVAYHFQPDGSPDRWLSRGAAIVWAVAPQLFLTLLAGAITWGITRLSRLSGQTEGTWIKPERVLSLMGNIIALPQIVLCFAMLDIFSYNSYQMNLMSVWVFALIIMVLGGIILGIFFIQAIRRAWATTR
ncbi:MAG: DUF1648 domain-containing protein [Dehalococcoidia bacterium]|nr:MAG: DUF1648 domain-containing protein [Dehalococcoidia bacterium]